MIFLISTAWIWASAVLAILAFASLLILSSDKYWLDKWFKNTLIFIGFLATIVCIVLLLMKLKTSDGQNSITPNPNINPSLKADLNKFRNDVDSIRKFHLGAKQDEILNLIEENRKQNKSTFTLDTMLVKYQNASHKLEVRRNIINEYIIDCQDGIISETALKESLIKYRNQVDSIVNTLEK